jgi:hypothetical protein
MEHLSIYEAIPSLEYIFNEPGPVCQQYDNGVSWGIYVYLSERHRKLGAHYYVINLDHIRLTEPELIHGDWAGAAVWDEGQCRGPLVDVVRHYRQERINSDIAWQKHLEEYFKAGNTVYPADYEGIV